MTGVRDRNRLHAVAGAELVGHLGDRCLDAVVATLRVGCGVPIAVVNIVTANQQTYPAEVGIGAPCTTVPDRLSFCAEVVETGRPLSVRDASRHPVYSQNPLVLAGAVVAYAGVPLVDDGVVLGTVSIFDRRPRDFTDDEMEILSHQARLASAVLALRRSARTDSLTGLPNRALYLDRLTVLLARLDRRVASAAVLYVDIDDFKTINDTHGHAVGDAVLVELAHRLSGVLRVPDTLARLGGDEFAAACEDLTRADAERLAARLVAAVGAPWIIDRCPLVVEVSIGIAVTMSAGTTPAALLREADLAMYRAKRRLGSGWVLAGPPGAAGAAD